ncbi:serine/threonine protein kinase [Mycobacterium stomatepiae]|uniref:Serine/threonine protein kinase n=1 Tax=Mycobacterium stomatepiae TaxID=470076 RepID=A0A7I7Q9P0_9MYCO|nr:serine/threonine protein kinase [Mycobacterium stomatepiae]MCV7164333.1 serine/threonine protein kinase [Mycobacterium stomatepiae]BBY23048.1 hypothetical protein MSTO_32530 [Mycobacterium stomatepiae]
MLHPTNLLRAAMTAALTAALCCVGTATATADTTGSSADVNTLAKGYGLNNCQSSALTGAEVAELQCGQNPDSSGPASAVYQLFKSANDLSGAYASSLKDVTLSSCSGSGSKEPGPWHQASSDQAGGQMACGTYKGVSLVLWTVDGKNVLGSVFSKADVPSLYKWWQANA